MRKIVFMFMAALLCWQPLSFASSVDVLIQKLKDKGILTEEDAVQLKGEITYQEQESAEKGFKKNAPEWLSSLKIGGDFRVRNQLQRREAIGSNDLVRNRGRLRARLNLESQVNDKVKLNFTLATEGGSANGTLANNRSNNVTFGGNGGTNSGYFAKPYLAIDKAYVTYSPTKELSLLAGKMANPIWEPGAFFWDGDITPEGGAVQYSKKISDLITPFSTNAMFVLKDSTPTMTQRTNPYIFVTQEGLRGNLTEKVYYRMAGTGYFVTNQTHGLLDNRAAGNTISTSSASQYSANFNVVAGSVELGMNDPLGDRFPIYIPQVGVFGSYSDNLSDAKYDNAWMMGTYLGNSSLNGWGTWKLSTYYKVLQADAFLDSFPNDDFYSGNTNVKGWQSQLELGLAKNVWFSFSYFNTNVFKPTPAISAQSKSAPERLFQMDLNFKF